MVNFDNSLEILREMDAEKRNTICDALGSNFEEIQLGAHTIEGSMAMISEDQKIAIDEIIRELE